MLVLAGGAAAINLPFYSILVLPILFAAGMCLADTGDGVLMNAACGWAFARPVRKVFNNLTTTAISVIVALAIGTIELVGVLAERVRHHPRTCGRGRTHQPGDYAGYAASERRWNATRVVKLRLLGSCCPCHVPRGLEGYLVTDDRLHVADHLRALA